MLLADGTRSVPATLKRYRSGFTLLELLIVLAIVVMLVGASWPRLRTMLEKAELVDAAKGLRTLLSQARLDAIDSGTPRRFHYQPGGTLYEVGPYVIGDEDLQADAASQLPSAPVVQGCLPRGLRFAVPPSANPDGQPEAAVEEWSKPVLLYPNGRSANARIRIAGADTMFVDVELRGITGVAKVGAVQREVLQP